MKLKFKFKIVDMGDEIVAVPIGNDHDQLHGVIRVDKVGAEILSLLEEETTPQKVHEEMIRRYPDSTRNEIGKMLESFFNALLHEGILKP